MVEEDSLKEKRTDRRSYLKKLALGLIGAGALLSLRDVPKASAVLPPVYLGGNEALNDAGSAYTGIKSSTTEEGTLFALNSGSGGVGVFGYSDSGIGLHGGCGAATGIGVKGEAFDVGAVPMVARGWVGQTANLQEWQNSAGAPLSVVDNDGRIAIGSSGDGWQDYDRLKVVNLNGASYIKHYAYGGEPDFLAFRARGTHDAPLPVQSGDGLFWIAARGHGATGFPGGSKVGIGFGAAENWTDTAQGTNISFHTTPVGSTTRTERIRISPEGNVGIGTSTPSQKLHVKDGIARVEHSAPSGFDIRNTGASFDTSISVGTAGNPNYYANWNCASNTQSDITKPSWSVRLRVDTDQLELVRVAPGPGAITKPFTVNAAGEVLPGVNNTGSIGKEGQKWSLVRATTITPGDLVFENGIRATEEGRGLAFLNDVGEKIAILDARGNLQVKGKIVENPNL